MGKGSVKKPSAKTTTKGKTMKIMKSPKKDSKFTKTVTLYSNQKDYFKMDTVYAKW
jgi:hypothetical protein